MKKKKNLTRQEQLIVAIEFLSLAEEYIFRKKEMNTTELCEWLDELQNPEKEATHSDWSIERNFRLYRKRLNELGVNIAIKKKKIQPEIKNETALKILSLYLKSFCEEYSDKQLRVYFKSKDSDFLKVLQTFVFIRYAIKYELVIESVYQKLMNKSSELKRIIPRSIGVVNSYLTLVVTDLKDNSHKNFILANMDTIQSDLIRVYKNKRKISIPFNREEFEASPGNRFYWTTKTYRINFTPFSFESFIRLHDLKYTIIERSDYNVLVDIESDDRFLIQQILFMHGVYAKLLSPEEEVNSFKEKIGKIQEYYSD